MALSRDRHRLSVLFPPGQQGDVEYYASITRVLLITNVTRTPVLVDRVLLRFQSDFEQASVVVAHDCSIELAPNATAEETICVVPNAHYLPNTNTFDVVVWLRVWSSGGFGNAIAEHHGLQNHIVISEPKQRLGRIFISFKDPEDLRLKNSMEWIVRRAGFIPWTAHRDAHAGTDGWKEIEEAIRNSLAVVFIFTENTDFAEGVRREVELCRKHKIKEAPLLQRGIPVPKPYHDLAVRFERFDRETPTQTFVTLIEQVRNEVVEATTAS